MPRFSSALTDSSSHALSRMDDGPVELIDDASIVKRQSVQEKTPITITQAPATSTSISAAATIDKGIAVTSIEPAQAPPDTINDESVTSGMKRRRVVKLYVPRNGKFSNGLEKRSGLLFAAPADN